MLIVVAYAQVHTANLSGQVLDICAAQPVRFRKAGLSLDISAKLAGSYLVAFVVGWVAPIKLHHELMPVQFGQHIWIMIGNPVAGDAALFLATGEQERMPQGAKFPENCTAGAVVAANAKIG